MFNVGDKVVRKSCAQSIEWLEECRKCGLVPVDDFVVTSIGPCYICLKGLYHAWDTDNFEKVQVGEVPKATNSPVTHPSHYDFFPGVEAIQIIAASLTQAEFKGYCMGNRLKYRLRAGKKDKLEQDIQKSDFYLELYSRHVHLCKVNEDA